MRGLLLLLLLPACGRVNFDPRGDGSTAPVDALLPDSALVVLPPTQVSDPSELGRWPVLIWASDTFVLAYHAANPPLNTHVVRLQPSGQRIGTPTAVSTGGAATEHPSIVSAGSIYVVTWTDLRGPSSDIYGARLDANLNLLSEQPLIMTTNSDDIDATVILSQTGFGLYWRGGMNAREVRFASIDSTLQIVSPEVPLVQGAVIESSRNFVLRPGGFAAAYKLDATLRFMLLDASGARVGADMLVSPLANHDFALVATGTGYAVAWVTLEEVAWVSILDAAGNVLRAQPIAPAEWVELVYTGSGFGLTWSGPDSLDENYFVELDADGLPTSAAVQLSPRADTGKAAASLAWTGAGYGIAWEEHSLEPSEASQRGIYFTYIARP